MHKSSVLFMDAMVKWVKDVRFPSVPYTTKSRVMKTITRDFVVYGTVSERGGLFLDYLFYFFLTRSQGVKSIHFEPSVVIQWID